MLDAHFFSPHFASNPSCFDHKFAPLNSRFIMHIVCVCCYVCCNVSTVCVCVCARYAIVDKINIFENGFISMHRTHTNTRVSSCDCCSFLLKLFFFFSFQLLSDDTTQEIFSRRWHRTKCTFLHETEHRHVHWVDH